MSNPQTAGNEEEIAEINRNKAQLDRTAVKVFVKVIAPPSADSMAAV